MLNFFRTAKLTPVLPAKNVQAAIGGETTDPVYGAELEQSRLRTLLAKTQIASIHEHLAEKALYQLRGGKT